MLGYGDGTFTRESQFGIAPGGNFGMDNVKCSGSESDIRDCRHTTRDDCGPEEAAGAICSNFLGSNPDSSATPEGEYISSVSFVAGPSGCISYLGFYIKRHVLVKDQNKMKSPKLSSIPM